MYQKIQKLIEHPIVKKELAATESKSPSWYERLMLINPEENDTQKSVQRFKTELKKFKDIDQGSSSDDTQSLKNK